MMSAVEAAKRRAIAQAPRPRRAAPRGRIDVAQAATVVPIRTIAAACGLTEADYEPYGHYKAKISDKVTSRLKTERGEGASSSPASTPPPRRGQVHHHRPRAGDGGAHLDKDCVACIRQPSMGPTFGIKGGAAGGGYSQVIPMEEMNLHLTGDIHAIGVANNLLAAVDCRVFHELAQKDEALFDRLPGAQARTAPASSPRPCSSASEARHRQDGPRRAHSRGTPRVRATSTARRSLGGASST